MTNYYYLVCKFRKQQLSVAKIFMFLPFSRVSVPCMHACVTRTRRNALRDEWREDDLFHTDFVVLPRGASGLRLCTRDTCIERPTQLENFTGSNFSEHVYGSYEFRLFLTGTHNYERKTRAKKRENLPSKRCKLIDCIVVCSGKNSKLLLLLISFLLERRLPDLRSSSLF
jgi:hypothetical protein